MITRPLKKRIIIVIINGALLEAGLSRGGGIQNVDYYVSECLSKKYHIEIISSYYGQFIPRTEINNNFHISRVPVPAIDNYPPFNQKHLIYHIPYDVPYIIHTIHKLRNISKNSHIILLLHNNIPSLIIGLFGKLFGFKSVMFEGNLRPWCNPEILPNKKALMGGAVGAFCNIANLFTGFMVAKLSDCVVVQSILIKKGMIDHHIKPLKIKVIPVGIDRLTNNYVSNFNKRNKMNMEVAFIGRLVKEKGAGMLVEVIKMAETQLPNFKFLIFGDGEYRSELEHRSNVIYLGWLSKEKMLSKMLDVPVAIFFQKSVGLAELECMATGKVVIACNRGDVPEVIKDNITGILCELQPQDYIDAIKMIYQNKELMIAISQNAQNFVINNYSWDSIGEMWMALIDTIIQDNS